jgi:hypothetical protein
VLNVGRGGLMWWQSVRSIVAFLIVATFCIMAGCGKVEGKDFMAVVMLVITFYFLKDRTTNGGGK